MIVLAETNFIFEIALQQEECAACNEILDLSTSRRATLVLPAFSIVEAGMLIERRRGEWQAFQSGELSRRVREASRAMVLRRYVDLLNALGAELAVADKEERDEWARFRTSRAVRLIDMTGIVLADAHLRELNGMQMPDAIVLASVTSYLEKLRKRDRDTPAIFVSRDRDFLRAKRELQKLDCRIVVSFRDAAEILRRD